MSDIKHPAIIKFSDKGKNSETTMTLMTSSDGLSAASMTTSYSWWPLPAITAGDWKSIEGMLDDNKVLASDITKETLSDTWGFVRSNLDVENISSLARNCGLSVITPSDNANIFVCCSGAMQFFRAGDFIIPVGLSELFIPSVGLK